MVVINYLSFPPARESIIKNNFVYLVCFVVKKIEQLYNWLDSQIAANISADACSACGDCCKYEQFAHRIYVTTPEIIFLKNKLNTEKLKSAKDGTCPYQIDNKCSIRDYRFAPCRIFFCNADQNLQSQLSEKYLIKIKEICEEHNIEYKYQNLPDALKS